MSKKLIVNADDLGIHYSVNEAVHQAFEEGILTSTSLMAGGEFYKDAVNKIKKMNDIGVGVHLTLVGDIKPVRKSLEIPSLTWQNGIFCHNYIDLIKRDLKGLINYQEVYEEWDAQISKIINDGIKITHLDGHQHMHMWNSFFPITVELAKKYNIKCIRVPDEKYFFGLELKNFIRGMARIGLSMLSGRHRESLKKSNLKSNDWFWGMIYGGHFSEKYMLKAIDSLEEGVNEFMTHPSSNECAMEEKFKWGYHGESELYAILSDKVKEKIKSKKIELISYKDVGCC